MSLFFINAFADESDSAIKGQVDALKRNGLHGLEIRGVDGANVGTITLQKAREVKAAFENEGLMVWSVGSRLGKIKVDAPFEPHLDEFKHTIDLAHELGAGYIRMFSFFTPKGEEPEKYRNIVFERLGVFIETAKGSGVKLCHENEKGIYGDIASRCLQIHKAFPDLGCVFDPANFVQCNHDTLEAWEMLEPYVTYMHIKDALADGSVVPAGCGAGHLPELLKSYSAIGGKFLTIEPHLTVFKGLDALENEGDKSVVGKYSYPSNEAAFDAAAQALKAII